MHPTVQWDTQSAWALPLCAGSVFAAHACACAGVLHSPCSTKAPASECDARVDGANAGDTMQRDTSGTQSLCSGRLSPLQLHQPSQLCSSHTLCSSSHAPAAGCNMLTPPAPPAHIDITPGGDWCQLPRAPCTCKLHGRLEDTLGCPTLRPAWGSLSRMGL